MLPATDNFNRADADPIGGNWYSNDPQLMIIGNRCVTDYSTAAACWTGDTFNNDQYSQAKVASITSLGSYYMGVTVRAANNANTLYVFRFESTTAAYMYKVVTGSYTLVGSGYTVSAVQVGDLIKLRIENTTITPSINGGDLSTRTDSAISSGYAGLFIYDNGHHVAWDDWEGGNVGAATGKISATISGTSAITIGIRGIGRVASSISGVAALTPSLRGIGRVQTSIAGSSQIQSSLRGIGRIKALSSGIGTLTASGRAASALRQIYTLIYGQGRLTASIGPESALVGLSKANFIQILGQEGIGVRFLTKRQQKRIGR